MYLTRRMMTSRLDADRVVITNALTGEIDVVDGATAGVLDRLRAGADPAGLDPAVLAWAARRRMLFASAADEEDYFTDLCTRAWDDFVREAPQHYTFVLNTHCNFACPYCFESTEQRSVRSTMTIDQVDAAFHVMDASGAPPEVELFGGEPLLPGTGPVLEHALAGIERRGGRATLQTNGWYLPANVGLLERHPGVVRSVQVTIDGPPAVHDRRRVAVGGRGSFDKVTAGVEALARSDLALQINVRTNTDRENVDHLGDLVEIYRERGWVDDPRFTFTAAPVDNRGGGTDGPLLGWHELFDRVWPLSLDSGGGPFDLSVFKILGFFRSSFGRAARGLPPAPFVPRVNYCEAVALKLFVFHPDGSIYPCPEVLGRPDLAVGTYHPELVMDPERSAKWTRQTVLGRESCHECAISTICGGGCALAALMEHGTMDVPACEHTLDVVGAWFGRLQAALS